MDCDRYRRLTDADIHDETIHTTANHPWLTADHGWLVAGKLQVGEPVREADGSTAVVERLHVVPGAANMWDLTVSNIHTFAVGDGAFVVHNCGGETLNRFGRGLNTPDPRGPGVNPVRRGVDIDVDANDMVHAQSGQKIGRAHV